MIYLIQLIYVKEGLEEVFHQFEAVAMPAILKYNGRILLRIRPNENDIIHKSIEAPYEVHLVEFPDVKDFENFKQDKERQKFLHLKEQSVRSVFLIQGERI